MRSSKLSSLGMVSAAMRLGRGRTGTHGIPQPVQVASQPRVSKDSVVAASLLSIRGAPLVVYTVAVGATSLACQTRP